jgi:hypothetical protein
MQSSKAALRRHFEGELPMRIALECGTHSPWASRLLTALGHQATVVCAVRWCNRRNLFWGASAPTPSCAAGV